MQASKVLNRAAIQLGQFKPQIGKHCDFAGNLSRTRKEAVTIAQICELLSLRCSRMMHAFMQPSAMSAFWHLADMATVFADVRFLG
jgi:hypothetical protein